jgi:hypothetical protein
MHLQISLEEGSDIMKSNRVLVLKIASLAMGVTSVANLIEFIF